MPVIIRYATTGRAPAAHSPAVDAPRSRPARAARAPPAPPTDSLVLAKRLPGFSASAGSNSSRPVPADPGQAGLSLPPTPCPAPALAMSLSGRPVAAEPGQQSDARRSPTSGPLRGVDPPANGNLLD